MGGSTETTDDGKENKSMTIKPFGSHWKVQFFFRLVVLPVRPINGLCYDLVMTADDFVCGFFPTRNGGGMTICVMCQGA